MEEQKSTNRLIWRTAGITLFVIVMLVLLCFNIIGLAAPRVIAEGANRLGMGGVAVSFSKAQYERSGRIDDLADLCERAIKFGKYGTADEYLRELIDFDRDGESLATVAERREITVGGVRYDYTAYILGNSAYVRYKTGQAEDALAFAKENTGVYGAASPLGYLVDAWLEDGERSADYGLTAELASRQEAAEQDGRTEEDKLLCIDLYRICSALGDEERAAFYEGKLGELLGESA